MAAVHIFDVKIDIWTCSVQAPAFRQTVLFSSFAFPEMSALFSRRCSNWAGRALSRAQHQARSVPMTDT